jgi:hypothetical protein
VDMQAATNMGGAGRSHTPSFRRAVVRYAMSSPDALPLLMLLGAESLFGRTYRLAAGVYLEAFRVAPREPLVALALGVSLLLQVTSRATPNRHVVAMRGFAFLALYRRLRAEQAAATDAEAGTSLEALRAQVQGGDDDDAGVGGAALLATPPLLPPGVAVAETMYNCGRACHLLGLTHLAAHCYEGALAAPMPAPAAPGAAGGFQRSVVAAMDVRREAAFNLVLLLKASGAELRALEVTRDFLSYA